MSTSRVQWKLDGLAVAPCVYSPSDRLWNSSSSSSGGTVVMVKYLTMEEPNLL